MLAIENKQTWDGVWAEDFEVEGYDSSVVGKHLLLLADAGFLVCEKVTSKSTPDRVVTVMIFDLSWKGHEYLDAIRDPEIWRQAKSGAAKAGNAGFDFLIETAKAIAKSGLKEFGIVF